MEKSKIEVLICEIISKGINTASFGMTENGELYYEFQGFSKSGTAKIYQNKESGNIICRTRYNNSDVIETFDDLVSIAYTWYIDYKDREPFGKPDEKFLPYFIEKGLLKKVETTTISYK